MMRVRIDVQPLRHGPGWSVEVLCRASVGELALRHEMDAVEVRGRTVPVPAASRRPAPPAPHAGLCQGDEEELAGLLDRVASRQLQGEDARRYGQWLFESLLAPAWPAIIQHAAASGEDGVELALRWSPGANDLHRLIWEAMHDGTAPLAASPALLVAVTRLVPGNGGQCPQVIDHIPRVLFVSGARIADPTIRPGAMFAGLLRALESTGACRAKAIEEASIQTLREECARFGPDIVHLVAHGDPLSDGRGALMLRAEAGDGEQEADAPALVAALTQGSRPLAVILSACNTATGDADDPTQATPLAARLVAAGIPVVSAMAGDVGELACRLYTRRFTEALHAGGLLAEASAHGRRAALVGTPDACSVIDWALPTLLLTDDVQLPEPLVNTARVREVHDLAQTLGLRREPVFIGRRQLLDAADELVTPGSRWGVVAAVCEQDTSGLGGTRLLREIGWRLLRDGHLPLMPGPYPKDVGAPGTARELTAELLLNLVVLAEKLDLPPFAPLALAADAGVLPTPLSALPDVRELAWLTVRREISAFRARSSHDLELPALRGLLSSDLLRLARSAAGLRPPFGPHTRVVLLCDDVHAWAGPSSLNGHAPISALSGLLTMLDSNGLGMPEASVPVVLTSSLTRASGPTTKAWSEHGTPGIRVLTLDEFEPDDAALGFQWVLLHPWSTRQGRDDGAYQATYTSMPGKAADWERALRELRRWPRTVERDLHLVARVLTSVKTGRMNDDEGAWHKYANTFINRQAR